MEELEWSPCSESLDDILTNPKVQLPQLIKLSDTFISPNGESGGDKLEKDQIVVLHSRRTLAKLLASNQNGDSLRLPVKCPYKVKLTVPPGKEKTFDSIESLAKSEPLPKFVEVTQVDGVERVSVGDRLKVVIVEKSGGNPSFIHFRNSAGKHIKIAVNETISFCLAANDSSEQLLSKLAEKSRELPLVAKFVDNNETPKTHAACGIMTITKGFTEEVIIASAKKSKTEYVLIFPISETFKFQVNNNLKMANDEKYRELCSSASNVDVNYIIQYLHTINPKDNITKYVFKYKKVLKAVGESTTDSDSEKEVATVPSSPSTPPPYVSTKKLSKQEELILKADNEQKELIKKEQKEKERLAKAEKERLKAEKKKEKKERKEREKEEKKKRKDTLSRSNTDVSIVSEVTDEDMYIMPHSPIPQSSTDEQTIDSEHYQQQPQWALHLMKNIKKVRDRTKSVGLRSKKRGKLVKSDIRFDSTDVLDGPDVHVSPSSSTYAGLEDDAFSDSLYETLPCEMAYESLDLIAQAQRSFAPVSEQSGDSGFDEIEQQKINAWRESMAPPPLPGNHPHQEKIIPNNNDDLYEMAVDCNASGGTQMNTAWQSFYNIVEQSTKEIASWDMEDIAHCLFDLKLGKYQQIFADSQIDGQLLIDLDESVLRDLGLTPFEARKLRKFTFGWRPDVMRPANYPVLLGFESEDPSNWSENDVNKHLKVIDIKDFAEFCGKNQVNGDLLKDICVDDSIMQCIITSRDRKLKTVKIKNYVIDKWRPKKKGEGNYVSVSSLQRPGSANSSPLMKKSEKVGEYPQYVKSTLSTGSATLKQTKQASPLLKRSESSPYANRQRKISENAPLGIKTKIVGDSPLVARMKQQLEEKKNEWK